MLQRTYLCLALGLLMTGGIEGCTIMKSGSSTTLPSSAFFTVDAGELKPLQAVAHAQDSRMKNCHKGPACEEAYYTRGLVALFENRADAITVFQELHTAMPKSVERCSTNISHSSKVFSSRSRANRSRAVSLPLAC